jgi:two-component system sensor histidine kinase HydH
MPDGFVRVEVRDTGVGIAPQDLGRIFDPYFTTKPSGAGLGLAIVQKIVDAHGGEIRVESTPGQGTTVTILLPAKNQEQGGG